MPIIKRAIIKVVEQRCGSNQCLEFTIGLYSLKLEKALQDYERIFGKIESNQLREQFMDWDERQILDFIRKCLMSAKNEGSVKIYFG